MLLAKPELDYDTVVCRPELAKEIRKARPDLRVIEQLLTKPVQTKHPRVNKKKTRITKKFRKKYTIHWPDYSVYVINREAFNSYVFKPTF